MTPSWTTACPDWAERLKTGRSIIPPPIFPQEAAEGLETFKSLKLVDVANSPTIGECSPQWVVDFAASVFGSYDSISGRRLIKEWFLMVPKKNAKSTLAAGVMLTLLIRNWRMSASFTIIAPTMKIAKNSFDPARDMCSQDSDEELAGLTQVQSHIKTITHRATQAYLSVLAAESETVGGSKSTVVLVDELWLFGKRADAANMLREATGGLLSRPEGCVIYLTTQSDEPPAGVFAEKLKYARDVRDGVVVDPTFCPIIYEFPQDMIEAGEHLKPENFHIVNPNLGFSVDEEEIQRLHRQAASGEGEESLRGFMAKHLDVQIGVMLMSQRWAGVDYWQKQARKKLTLDRIIADADAITVGIDGGGLDDLLGLTVNGRNRTTKRWQTWSHAWAHPSVLERHKADTPRYRDFEADGDLTIVEALGDDLDELADICSRCEHSGKLSKIGLDQATIGGIVDALVKAKIPMEKIIGIPQGWRLTGAIKTAERKLADGSMEHCDQRLMDWCIGNCKAEQRGNATVITKQISGTAKIDPPMAMFNSVALMSLNPEGAPCMDDFLDDPVIG